MLINAAILRILTESYDDSSLKIAGDICLLTKYLISRFLAFCYRLDAVHLKSLHL